MRRPNPRRLSAAKTTPLRWRTETQPKVRPACAALVPRAGDSSTSVQAHQRCSHHHRRCREMRPTQPSAGVVFQRCGKHCWRTCVGAIRDKAVFPEASRPVAMTSRKFVPNQPVPACDDKSLGAARSCGGSKPRKWADRSAPALARRGDTSKTEQARRLTPAMGRMERLRRVSDIQTSQDEAVAATTLTSSTGAGWSIPRGAFHESHCITPIAEDSTNRPNPLR